MNGDAPPSDLMSTIRNQADDEGIATGRREVFVAYGERGIGKSRRCTSRPPMPELRATWNTVAKLAELAREME